MESKKSNTVECTPLLLISTNNVSQNVNGEKKRKFCKEEDCSDSKDVNNSSKLIKFCSDEEKTSSCSNCSYCPDHSPKTRYQSKMLLKALECKSVSADKKKDCKGKGVEGSRVECEECKKTGFRRTFKSETGLQQHLKSVHEESDQVFTCSQCPSDKITNFTSKKKYLQHLSSEHRTLLFICDICCEAFKLKVNFKAHMLTHNVPPKKNYMCETCESTFAYSAGYEMHKKKYPGYHLRRECPHCNVSFYKESKLANHRCKKLQIEEAAKLAEQRQLLNVNQHETQKHNFGRSSSRREVLQYQETINENDELIKKESEQLTMPELSNQIVTGAQVLQFEVADGDQSQQTVYHVNVADWSVVAPFVIRDTQLATLQQRATE